MVFRYAGTSIQNHRQSNMDSLLLKMRKVDGHDLCLAAVCDGVGSLENGGYASSYTVRMLSQWFDGIQERRRLGIRLRDYLLELNSDIVMAASERAIRTATTLSVLLLDGETYCAVHVGDSRIYHYFDGRLTQITEDQVRDGELLACFGYSADMTLCYYEGTIVGGLFLLCSDGLYKRMDYEHLVAALSRVNRKNIQKTAEELTGFAQKMGEKDNISLAIIMSER